MSKIREFVAFTFQIIRKKLNKKSPDCSGLSIFKRLKDYFFFSFFSILAFKPARISLLSPRVEAGALVLEDTAS